MLFVINKSTTMNDISSIQKHCDSIGLNPNFYDISLMKELDLLRGQVTGRSMASDMQGKIICIVDTEFNISPTNQHLLDVRGLDYLVKDQMITCIKEFGIRFALITSRQFSYYQWLIGKMD